MNKADEALAQAQKEKDAEAAKVVETPAPPAKEPPKPATTTAKAATPAPKPAPPKPKVSVVELRFNEGMRDVEVKIVQDQGTMTPRKIEHATYVLMKTFRQHLGQLQASEARKARAAEAAKTDGPAK